MKTIDLVPLNFKKIIFIALSFALINSVFANTPTIKPFIKGSFQEIQQQQDKSHKDKAYIITFWSETCAFCMEELTLLGKLLKTYPDVELISITTDPFLNEKTITRILSSKNLQQAKMWVFSENYAERLYFDVDKRWRGELPLTFFVDRNHKLLKHMGTINKHKLIEWFEQQKTAPKKEEL
jgi:thiol-disulfide isomerase/thioredoxin